MPSQYNWNAITKPVVRHDANGYDHKERIEHKEPQCSFVIFFAIFAFFAAT